MRRTWLCVIVVGVLSGKVVLMVIMVVGIEIRDGCLCEDLIMQKYK